jgi:hypothetical protein
LIATAKVLPHIGGPQEQPLRTLLVRHATKISNAIISTQRGAIDQVLLDGSFDDEGRIAPCATRLEGLLAARSLLSHTSDSRNELEYACDRGVRFLLRAQITDGAYTGGFTRSIYGHPAYALTVGDERSPRASEIRIDYVQHALCALLEYRGRK